MSPSGQGRGVWYGLGAYSIWGLFPIYWKLIDFVPADQVIAHRIVWSFLLLVLVRLLPAGSRERMTVGPVPPPPGLSGGGPAGAIRRRVVGLYTAAAALIAVNWFLYVWAVSHDFILETSLATSSPRW